MDGRTALLKEQFALLLVALLAFAGCATREQRISSALAAKVGGAPASYQEGERMTLGVVSFLPPSGAGWSAVRGPEQVTFGASVPNSLQTLVATVQTKTFTEAEGKQIAQHDRKELLKAFADNTKAGFLAERHFQLVKLDVHPEQLAGVDCVRFDIVSEDRRGVAEKPTMPPIPEARGKVLIMTLHGYNCLSFGPPAVKAIIFWSQRGPSEAELPPFPGAEEFLHSLRFTARPVASINP